MFGEKNNRYWEDFNALIGGGFEKRKYWHSAKCTYTYRGFDLVFDNYAHHVASSYDFVTRVYCQFSCGSSVSLKIDRSSLANKLVFAIRGDKRLQTHHPEFNNRYVLSSEDSGILSVVNDTVLQQILDNEIDNLFIDNRDGIWGEELENDRYELAAYIDEYKVEYTKLIVIKDLFRIIIDNLIKYYRIRSK